MEQQPIQHHTLGSVEESYDRALLRSRQIQGLLGKLVALGDCDEIQEMTSQEQYITLLGNLLYTLNSTVHCLCQTSGRQFPAQFDLSKVRQEYMKTKNVFKNNGKGDSNPIQVNKQAAARLIKHGITQNPQQ